MSQKFVLAILHRELRVDDNSAISIACNIARDAKCKVKIIFKFDDRQISPAKNKYFGANGFIFMLECLSALTDFVHILDVNESFGKPIAIVTTADYTPFAVKRLTEYKKIGVPVIVTTQHIVSHPDLIRTNAGGIFEMNFAQFANAAEKKIKFVQYKVEKNLILKPDKSHGKKILLKYFNKYDSTAEQHGGRNLALRRLSEIAKWKNGQYNKIRDIMTENTTRLSPYMKFGCLSLRELWEKTPDKNIQRQYLWRSYYYYLSYHFPVEIWENREFSYAMKQPWGKIDGLQNLMNGNSGVPLIDAGINQLVKTGFVHNRIRMITADYCKRKKIDWRVMEKMYANFLTDYDPTVNLLNWMYMNGAWHWQFKTRYFNPDIQAKKYDPEKKYVNKYLYVK